MWKSKTRVTSYEFRCTIYEFKRVTSLSYKYMYFQWMQFISAIPSNWKNIIKRNNDINTFTATQHHFVRSSRVLTVQKATSKELYWILITTIEYKSTSQESGLFLSTYCVRYPHAVPFLRNELPYFLRKTPKRHTVWEG